MIPENWRYSRGDIYYANMEPHVGSEQGGERPVVVLPHHCHPYIQGGQEASSAHPRPA